MRSRFAGKLIGALTSAAVLAGAVGAVPVSAQEGLDEDTLEFVDAMGAGWNLGNTLDAHGNWASGVDTETCWGVPKTTKAMIEAVHDAGFETIRIPVSWAQHVDSSYKIDQAFMARVKEVVDYAYDEGMYVILNVHHDESTDYESINGMGYYPDSEHREKSLTYLTNVWQQISETFKDYDESLIFETLNEPRLCGTQYEWSSPRWVSDQPLIESCEIINTFNQEIVNVIRKSGGENATRRIMCPGYAASADSAIADVYKLPTDPISTNQHKIMVSTHAYTPYDLCLASDKDKMKYQLDDNGRSQIDGVFSELYNKFIKNGTAVIMGECGVTFKNNQSECDAWASYYYTQAEKYDIPAVLWDNNVRSNPDGPGECHQHFDRSSLTWADPTFIKAIMDTVVQDTEPDKEGLPGDADENGDVNINDVLIIQQFIAEWKVTVNEENCDVNNDGKININDVLLIQQYIAEWDVELI
ncbi:MAG: cellulase family glycosylhydrolase [Ruminococcus sp.]|nr:cellulase family glycosylhydrolase [Ruminococcus sp.]